MLQVKQIEMDNILNFEANSMLHTTASRAITTHIIEREINKENEEKLKKKIFNTNKDPISGKGDKKNVNLFSKAYTISNSKKAPITASKKK